MAFSQEQIIAIVNNDAITQNDLNDFINFFRMQLQAKLEGQNLEDKIKTMTEDLLDRLIEDRLILQEAKRIQEEARIKKNPYILSRLEVDQNRVKAKIDEMKKRYTQEIEFQHALSQQGLTQADIELRIREQLLMYNIIDLKVRSKILVSPSEVTDFYEQNLEQFKTFQERQVLSIAMDDEALSKKIFTDLKDGKDFNTLANQHLLSVNKINVQPNGELRRDIEDMIFRLNIGQISVPTKINGSFYIFKLDNIIAPRQQNLSEVQDRIYVYLFEKKMQEELAGWLDELKKNSYIKIFTP